MRFATIAPRRDSLHARLTPAAAAVLVSLLLAVSASAVDLADTPMFTRILPPPANLMFVLDDSGSMNFEILVTGQYDGSFPDPDQSAADLASDPPASATCSTTSATTSTSRGAHPDGMPARRAASTGGSSGPAANVMYYNPAVTYSPWPGYGSVSFGNADPNTPRSHPVNGSYTLDLAAQSFSVGVGRGAARALHRL